MLDRLSQLLAESRAIVQAALDEHLDGRELVGRAVLFSGGNDSTTLAHIFTHQVPQAERATHAIHANTTIGVEATRQFVRDTCAAWNLPLLEKLPPTSYADLVVEQGFPGPAMHFKMYQRLKERGLRLARRDLVTDSRRQRVLFIAGRRRAESSRRASVPENEREGSVIWASPLANWTADDLALYRQAYSVPRNPVADQLGMSGECLCGAFAEPGEFDRLAHVCPEVAQDIVDLEEKARVNGVAAQKCQWGWGAYRADPSAQPVKTGPLCSSCDARWQPIPDVDPSPELQAIQARRASRKES